MSERTKHQFNRLKNIMLRKKPSRIRSLIERHRLFVGITGVVIMAIILTVINMTLYIATGTSKLDLSRPGYESARKEVSDEDKQDKDQNFTASGPLTKGLIDTYLVSYQGKQQMLKRYDTFDAKVLDNSQLNLPAPSGEEQPQPISSE